MRSCTETSLRWHNPDQVIRVSSQPFHFHVGTPSQGNHYWEHGAPRQGQLALQLMLLLVFCAVAAPVFQLRRFPNARIERVGGVILLIESLQLWFGFV